MNPSEMKPFEVHLEHDPDGCLYERNLRGMVDGAAPGLRPGLEALGALRLAGRQMHLGMERFAERHGLSEGRFQLMARLMKAEGRSLAMADLAASLRVSPRNITGLVDHLEKDGYVERVPDPDDRRSILARLTDAGAEKFRSLWKESLDAQSRLTAEFTKQELVQLRHLCLRLVQTMSERR